MPRIKPPPEPWRSFFAEVDGRLNADVHLHCCGGFVATQLYGVARTTSDVDFLAICHRCFPARNYEQRLVPMYPGAFVRLRLEALEAHDLALTKLERNRDRDRDDVQQLAQAGRLKPEVLTERYYNELRPNLLAHEARHDFDAPTVARVLLAIVAAAGRSYATLKPSRKRNSELYL
jgi:hypothetical protein